MNKSFFARWRGSFLTGLAITLPAIISIAAVKWLFGTVSSFTDALLFFLKFFLNPKEVAVAQTFRVGGGASRIARHGRHRHRGIFQT